MSNCVYKITNLINNKVYIGSTNNFERRIKEHKTKSTNLNYPEAKRPLYYAFRKYGIENFSFDIIEDNIETLTLARQKEAQYILNYNSLVPNGYNIKENTEGMSELDIQHLKELTGTKCALVDINNNIIKTFLSLRDAEKEEHCAVTSISNVCKGLQFHTNNKIFRFLDEDEKIITPEINTKTQRHYIICGISMFDITDILYFFSVKEAAETVQVTPNLISNCIKGNSRYKQVKQRIWRLYINGQIIENIFKIQDLIETYNKQYILFNGERKTREQWAASLGISNNTLKVRLAKMPIEEALSMPKATNAGGTKKAVCCNTGEHFSSASEAARWCGLAGGTQITACCKGKRLHAGKHPITHEKLTWTYDSNI